MTIEELKCNVSNAVQYLLEARFALSRFEELAENNVYDSLESAKELEEILRAVAKDDCEGSYCCGNTQYRRMFIVGGETYVATLEVEYNRHDKTYYYVDNTRFSIIKNNNQETK